MRSVQKLLTYGKYCGKNYCGGDFTSDCDYSVEPIDAFDRDCQAHDYFYENAPDTDFLREADTQFIKRNPYNPIARLPHLFNQITDYSYVEMTKTKTAKAKSKARRKNAKRQHTNKLNKTGFRRRPNGPKPSRQQPRATSAPAVAYAPRRFAVQSSSFAKDWIIESGTELIGNISMDNTRQSGDVLISFALSPQAFQNRRLGLLSQLFEQYEVIACRIEFDTAQTTAKDGSICMYIDPDPSDLTGAGLQETNKALSEAGNSGPVAVWGRGACTLPAMINRRKKVLYTNDATDLRQSQFGQFVAVCIAPTSSSSIVIGTCRMYYKIRFFGKTTEFGGANTNTLQGKIGSITASGSTTNLVTASTYTLPSANTISFVLSAGSNYGLIVTSAIAPGNYLIAGIIPQQATAGTLSMNLDGVNAFNISSNSSSKFFQFTQVKNFASTTNHTIEFFNATATGAWQALTGNGYLYMIQLQSGLTEKKKITPDQRIQELEEQMAKLMELSSKYQQPLRIEEEFDYSCPNCNQTDPDHLSSNCPALKNNNLPLRTRKNVNI